MGATTYTYDSANRLVNQGAYAYDWVGNRTTPGDMVYNAADQLVEWPGEHVYAYDSAGNLTYEYDSSGQTLQKTYSYTPAGLLESVVHAGIGTSSMTWDADGNRVSFTSSSTSGVTEFVYDVTAGIPAVIEETGPVYYIREPNGSLIARIDDSGANPVTRYYHFDALGSTRLLTNASGAVTDEYTYDAWGNLTNHAQYNGSVSQPYQFVGQLGYYTHVQDANLPLLQLGVRMYDPETGRFGQEDPLLDTLSLYSYVDNMVTSVADPTGKIGAGQAGGGVAGVITAVKCTEKCTARYVAEMAVCTKLSNSQSCQILAQEELERCKIKCGLFGLACTLGGSAADDAAKPRGCKTYWQPPRWLKPGIFCQGYDIWCDTGEHWSCSKCWQQNSDGSLWPYDANPRAPECTRMK